MTPPDNHQPVEIESFEIPGIAGPVGAGPFGKIGLRPVSGQKFPASLLLEGNKSLVQDYPVGTRFKVQATLMNRASGAQYLFTSWQWDVQVVATPDQVS
jgi:hypothetical protein